MSGYPISSSKDLPSNQTGPLPLQPPAAPTRKAYLGREVSESEGEETSRISEILEQMAVNFSNLVTSLTEEPAPPSPETPPPPPRRPSQWVNRLHILIDGKPFL